MTTMPFGKFRGVCIEDLPDHYLSWLFESIDLREPLRTAVEYEMRQRRMEAAPGLVGDFTIRVKPGEISVVCEIVDRGVRAAALVHHPDRIGGDGAAMTQINIVAASLRKQLTALGSIA